MKIVTYKSVDLISFGMSENEVVNQLGNPLNIRTNNENELEYHYDRFIIRYDTDNKLVRECTLLPQVFGMFQINDVLLDLQKDFFKSICELDGEPYEFYGYIVLFNLGISLTGFHDCDESQKAISVFRQGDWDRFKGDMIVFKS